MNDCGPTLWATRSRRCINSATRSLSSNTGAGGVSLMFEAAGLSLFAPAELTNAITAQITNNTNATRDFLIYVLLLKFLCLLVAELRRWLWCRIISTAIGASGAENPLLSILRNQHAHAVGP